MGMNQAIESFIELSEYCKSQAFKGWDPYDGLNSRVFQAIPFASRSSLMRLIVIQGFKRSPINLRRLAWVSKEYNPNKRHDTHPESVMTIKSAPNHRTAPLPRRQIQV